MADAVKTIRINIDASGARTGANQVNAALGSINKNSSALRSANDNAAGSMDRLSKSMSGASKHGAVMDGILGNIQSSAGSTVPVIGNLVGSLGRMGPMAAIVAAVGVAIVAVGVAAVQAAAKVQVWKANLETVVGSAQAADSAYRGLVNFAASTPFTLDQSVEGFTKLRALGLSTSTDIMTSYGNTSAAMGKSMTQMIEAVADATTGEFERLKEFGIKARTEGDNVAFTFKGATKTVGKNAQEIEKYLIGIGNTEFGGAMERQMATISGGLSNLEDSIFQMFAAIGDGQLGALIGDVFNTISSGVTAVTPLLSGIGDVFGAIFRVVWELIKGVGQLFTVQFGGAEGATDLLNTLGGTFTLIADLFVAGGKIIGSILGGIAQIAGSVVGFIQNVFQRLFGWLLPSFDVAGQSAGEALIGILRAAEFIADNLPKVFQSALLEIKAMFAQAGEALTASLQGDFSKWGDIDLSFKQTGRAASALWEGTKNTFFNQEANRARLDATFGGNDQGNLSYDALGGNQPGANVGGGKSEADKAAERLKSETEFWEVLKNEAATAALLPIAAENHKKQLELQKILGRDLLEAERERVDTALQLIRTNEFLTRAKEDSLDANRKAGIEEELTRKRLSGASDAQLEVERKVLEFRADAQTKGLDLQSDAYRLAEDQLRTDLARLDANKQLNDQLNRAVGLAGQYSQTYQDQQAALGYVQDREAARVAYQSGEFGTGDIAKRTYEEILEGIEFAAGAGARQMKDEFGQSIAELGDMIGGTWGRAISGLGGIIRQMVAAAEGDLANAGPVGSVVGALSGMFGKDKGGELVKEFSKSSTEGLEKLFKGETWTKPLQGMTDSFASFKGSVGQIFGKGGDLMKGLGSVMGTLGAGAQIGQMVSGVGKAIWGKFSSTGSQIGGALGNIFGPIGSFVGSTLGGIIGGLFKKTKYGTATLTGAGAAQINGNKTSYREAASGAAGSVQEGLAAIADAIGGTIGSYSLSIGTYKDKWRVRDSAYSGKLNFSGSSAHGLHDFGDDQEAAIRYAIANAVADGAIQGIRASTNRLLKAGSDVETQLEKALRFEGVFKDLAALKDPVTAAVTAINDEFEALTSIFREAGATASEYADLEEYRSLKMQDLMKQETETLQDILKELNGTAGGASPLAMLTRDMAEFATFQSAIAAGEAIDQSAYSELVGSIIDNASIYGANSLEYQSIVDEIRAATEGAIDNIEDRIKNDPTTNAIMDQTNALLNSQATTNDYLAQIAAAMNGHGNGYTGSSSMRGLNGKLVRAI